MFVELAPASSTMRIYSQSKAVGDINRAICELLVDRGADFNTKDDVLADRGADFNTKKDNVSRTNNSMPLNLIQLFLFNYVLDLYNMILQEGKTPMQYLDVWKDLDLYFLLLRRGAKHHKVITSYFVYFERRVCSFLLYGKG